MGSTSASFHSLEEYHAYRWVFYNFNLTPVRFMAKRNKYELTLSSMHWTPLHYRTLQSNDVDATSYHCVPISYNCSIGPLIIGQWFIYSQPPLTIQNIALSQATINPLFSAYKVPWFRYACREITKHTAILSCCRSGLFTMKQEPRQSMQWS